MTKKESLMLTDRATKDGTCVYTRLIEYHGRVTRAKRWNKTTIPEGAGRINHINITPTFTATFARLAEGLPGKMLMHNTVRKGQLMANSHEVEPLPKDTP